jgi:hypothetical protein
MTHNNSNESMKPNHLYEIVDKIDEDTFKYGISCDPIGDDGMSDRMRKQINYLNRLYEWERYFGRILIYDISGKKEARVIERQHIIQYEVVNGHKPKGNPRY